LPHQDDTVQVTGIYLKYNAVPGPDGSNPVYRAGILMEGDSLPKVFLFDETVAGARASLNGKRITLSGVFAKEQRLLPGDPPYASRMNGSWLYDVADLKVLEE
jgi:hypothetical protein